MTLQLPVSSAELTRAEQKILDFINTNPDTFLFSSIGQLAQQLELSDATLSRFARHVGCQDFKELKNLVLEQSASGPAVKLAGALQEGESFSLSAWMNRQQLYLQKTAEQLDPAEFERAVQALIQARQVYIHGKNASGSLAQLLFFRPSSAGREGSFSTTPKQPVTPPCPLSAEPVFRQRKARRLTSFPTAAPRRNTTRWLLPAWCWTHWWLPLPPASAVRARSRWKACSV